MTRFLRSSKFWLPNRALLVVISFMIASGVVSAQTARKPAGTEDEPVFHEYRGVKLGWVEGVEVNFLCLVAGLDLRRPGIKLPGFGRIGMPQQTALAAPDKG